MARTSACQSWRTEPQSRSEDFELGRHFIPVPKAKQEMFSPSSIVTMPLSGTHSRMPFVSVLGLLFVGRASNFSMIAVTTRS